MAAYAQKANPNFTSRKREVTKAVKCKHCGLKTYSPALICAVCELFGPVRSKKMQKEFSKN